MPLHQSMDFIIQEKKQRMPLLHLIYQEAHEQFHQQFREQIVKTSGADRNIKCPKGRTPHHILAKHGKDFGKDPFDLFAPDNKGSTPLHFYAASATHHQLNTCLKPVKRSVDVEDIHGITPLFGAIDTKKLENVRVLLERGANPNHTTAALRTPLVAAVT